MLTNSIVDDEISTCSYVASRKRRRREISVGHEMTVRPNFTRIWKTNDKEYEEIDSIEESKEDNLESDKSETDERDQRDHQELLKRIDSQKKEMMMI